MVESRDVLTIDGLVVEFGLGGRRGLDEVTMSVKDNDILGLVGETGSGKSLTLLSVMGLLPHPARIAAGSIRYRGRELTRLSETEYRKLRGQEIAVVVQNAKSALNPLARIGAQIGTVLKAKTPLRGSEIAAHARSVLSSVGFRDPDRVLSAYPHQISGGMAQRVLIAMAIGASPRLVLFDEPTSGLDATVAIQVMDLIRKTVREAGASAILVTHDLGIVGRYCDHVALMDAGRVADEASVERFFAEDANPHRRRLIEAHLWSISQSGDDRRSREDQP